MRLLSGGTAWGGGGPGVPGQGGAGALRREAPLNLHARQEAATAPSRNPSSGLFPTLLDPRWGRHRRGRRAERRKKAHWCQGRRELPTFQNSRPDEKSTPPASLRSRDGGLPASSRLAALTATCDASPSRALCSLRCFVAIARLQGRPRWFSRVPRRACCPWAGGPHCWTEAGPQACTFLHAHCRQGPPPPAAETHRRVCDDPLRSPRSPLLR
ncbi:uncharacterized protein LOC123823249 [Phyllostomus hastatus]|uniref:uncharacterized protein LOC123823249 n=1 Tax=Phyllostomus hastatus TaxID=9423 RepID=UPI001E684663|nr:uncharacterized protein LOC123823249 [Phyllostomus hastatus]